MTRAKSGREPLWWKLTRRWICHGSFWCCKAVDTPQCGSPHDPHRLARVRHAWRER